MIEFYTLREAVELYSILLSVPIFTTSFIYFLVQVFRRIKE